MTSQSLDSVLSLAADEALALGHGYVGPEHLLIACSQNATPDRIAVLARHGLDPEVLRRAIGAATGRELRATASHIAPPLSSRARRAVERAGEQAAEPDAPEATPDDLLLAVLEDAIATGGVIGAALDRQRVTRATLRLEILAVDRRDHGM